MFNKKYKKGFTLIELLIVIAIIGVLAATVVVSLGSQTDKAQQGSVKIGVSSIRNLATIAVVEGKGADGTKLTGSNKVCKAIFPQVSGEKGDWTWGKDDPSDECKSNVTLGAGEICCSSVAATGGNPEKWVLWGAAETGNVYCADSTGFAGSVTLAQNSATSTDVKTSNGSKVAETCQP